METWQVLVSVSVLMLAYVLVSQVTGSPASPVGLVLAVVFGLLGWVIGQRLTERFN